MHTSQTPIQNNNANGQQITLGTGFYVGVASRPCYGVRFWAPLTNTGTYTVSLWQQTTDDDPNGTGTGTLITSQAALASSITANAWNVVLFPSSVNVTSGQMWRVAVHTSSGRYVASANFFSSNSLSGDDVVLYQSGDDPLGTGTVRNGLFLDNANGYPNTVFQASDYFVEPWMTASGLSGALGRVSVACAARSVPAAPKAANLGRVTESHTARAATAAKARTAGRVTVSEAARTLSRAKSRAVGRVVSPDAARSVSRSKLASMGRVTVAESARVTGRLKSAALGRAVSAEAARPLAAGLTVPVSPVVVAEASRAVSRQKARALARVLAGESARSVLRAKARSTGRVLAAETALAVLRRKAVALSAVTVGETARHVSTPQDGNLGRVSESATARNVGVISGSDLIGQWGTDIGLG